MNTRAKLNSEELEAHMRRIAKLLAMANDGRGDPNEAAAAAAMAEKLMRKFNIDHADVLREQMKDGRSAFATVECSANMKRGDPKRPPLKRNPLWAQWLSIRVADLNDCKVRMGRRDPDGAILQFCGTSMDVQVAGFMFDYLVGELIKGVRKFNSECVREKAEGDSYRKAFIIALCDKLDRINEERKEEMARTSSGTALVVAKEQALVEHFGPIKYGEAREPEMTRRDAAARGFHEGSSVDTNVRGVRHEKSDAPLLLSA